MGENIRLNDNPFAADPMDGFDDMHFADCPKCKTEVMQNDRYWR